MAPQLASVVTVAQREQLAKPKHTSMPYIFTPGCWRLALRSDPLSSGLPRASAQYATLTPARNRRAMAHHTAQPCRCEPVMRPNVYVRPAPMAKIMINSKKFENGVGFS